MEAGKNSCGARIAKYSNRAREGLVDGSMAARDFFLISILSNHSVRLRIIRAVRLAAIAIREWQAVGRACLVCVYGLGRANLAERPRWGQRRPGDWLSSASGGVLALV